MNRDADFLPARGIQFARLAMAKAAGQNQAESLAYAVARWGARSTVVQLLKADVGGHGTGDADFQTSGTSEHGAEFSEMVDTQGLLRSGFAAVPAGVPFIGAVTDPAAGFVGAGRAIPVSRAMLDRSTIQPMTIASMIVVTEELLKSTDPGVELLVLGMMIRAARRAGDLAISDPSNAGDAETPASITANAVSINSSGDLADDLEAAVAAYRGSLATACIWTHPRLAVQAVIRAGAVGVGAGLGVRGGQLAGMPVFCSDGIPDASDGSPLILLDRASVAMVDEGYEVIKSRHSTIEMSDAPTGVTTTPVSAGTGTKMVSLFQEGAIALRLLRHINWHSANPGAVVVVENCSYPAP